MILLEQACYTSSEQYKTGRQTNLESWAQNCICVQHMGSGYIPYHKKTQGDGNKELSLWTLGSLYLHLFVPITICFLQRICKIFLREASPCLMPAPVRMRHWLLRLVSTAANMWSLAVRKWKPSRLPKLWLLPSQQRRSSTGHPCLPFRKFWGTTVKREPGRERGKGENEF